MREHTLSYLIELVSKPDPELYGRVPGIKDSKDNVQWDTQLHHITLYRS